MDKANGLAGVEKQRSNLDYSQKRLGQKVSFV